MMTNLMEQCKVLQNASKQLSSMNTKDKNEALRQVAISLQKNESFIIQENQKDVENAEAKGMKESLVDRLRLTKDRVEGMIKGIQTIIELKDPVWKSNEVWTLENGLTVSKMTVPIGVIGIIYESRPNVTVDAFCLTLKSGNGVLLRGSSTSIFSNRALVHAIKEGLKNSDVSEAVISLIDDPDRGLVKEMLTLNEYIDLIIPRGGKELIDFVVKNATVPTIETGVGNCHIFVDESANIDEAVDIIENAKVQRPGVCNACETVLIHEKIAKDLLPKVSGRIGKQVEIRGCQHTQSLIGGKLAIEDDWAEEFLDYIVAVKVVPNVDEAIEHINHFGTKHSEAILTENLSHANQFLRQVDAAAVYVNASTRFTDGSEFGFGGEMGISTQKIHARGPMGLNELVTVKYTIVGNGQIRK
ncbi:gamma-glutamyl phosphate reductase [Alkaliphilus metalliredigens QYMF]|uniref:Gamma-glutamyl phosphate reductase n=1 Tax=Alkaliphilus metalliredigens (strain QYMF) TaxID=293826 RepID=PROA_ALKMQ|nr:glutamate-5-semialdehyde dehydrogenase [Alkaliphilus metalliredigens]A6TUA0.1 RecName: Full=Gamma-glutamyl phosphate reductase; Short=GPR; AltName: Full=Glutamate-5-semialdehyde dehydrogenase; AltName: Full=Glutamyl-gamma-semialdehyde dehydrogenase; Short=GSA dehydrogenase [Alkaliphilus metalliredigens QYMF]ABR49768.1 gamma-glutamyl phosphate reductase [Alkaliphilus metalliredigens QYMF]